METVILISVLATLGVVIIIGLIVVAFVKLKSKVDSSDYESQFISINQKIDEGDNNNNRDIHSALDELYRSLTEVKKEINDQVDSLNDDVQGRIDQTQSTIDSRCDRLYTDFENQNAALRHQDGEIASEMHALIDEVHRRINELNKSSGDSKTIPNSTSSDILG